MRAPSPLSLAMILVASCAAAASSAAAAANPAAVQAQPAGQAPADEETAPEPLEKKLLKELKKGRFIDRLEKKGPFPKKLFEPSRGAVEPFINAEIGAPAAFQVVADDARFVEAPELQAYAQGIVDTLLQGVNGQRPAVEVRIVARSHYGARATETGLLLVNIGTFDPENGAATKDELAMLLGHEVAHILLDHMRDRGGMGGVVKLLGTAASGYMSYGSVKNSKVVNGKLQVEGDQKVVANGLVGGLAATTLLGDMLAPSFDRGKELEADRLGLDLARRAGFAVGGGQVTAFIKRHGEDQARMSQRVENLRIVLTALTVGAGQEADKKVDGDLGHMLGGLVTKAGTEMASGLAQGIAGMSKKHPDPEERARFMQAYLEEAYPSGERDKEGRLLRRDAASLQAVAALPKVARLMADIHMADELNRILTETDPTPTDTDPDPIATALVKAGFKPATVAQAAPAKAKAKPAKGKAAKGKGAAAAAPSLSFTNDSAAYTWEVGGNLALFQGNATVARTAWEHGAASSFASVNMTRRLGESLDGDAAKLDALIDSSAKRIGTSDPVLDLVVAAAVAKGDTAAAEVAAAKCLNYDEGRLYPACAARLGYDPSAEGQVAQTDEGRAAFAGGGLQKSLSKLTSLGGLFK